MAYVQEDNESPLAYPRSLGLTLPGFGMPGTTTGTTPGTTPTKPPSTTTPTTTPPSSGGGYSIIPPVISLPPVITLPPSGYTPYVPPVDESEPPAGDSGFTPTGPGLTPGGFGIPGFGLPGSGGGTSGGTGGTTQPPQQEQPPQFPPVSQLLPTPVPVSSGDEFANRLEIFFEHRILQIYGKSIEVYIQELRGYSPDGWRRFITSFSSIKIMAGELANIRSIYNLTGMNVYYPRILLQEDLEAVISNTIFRFPETQKPIEPTTPGDFGHPKDLDDDIIKEDVPDEPPGGYDHTQPTYPPKQTQPPGYPPGGGYMEDEYGPPGAYGPPGFSKQPEPDTIIHPDGTKTPPVVTQPPSAAGGVPWMWVALGAVALFLLKK